MSIPKLLSNSLPNDWKSVPLKSVCFFTVSNVDKHTFENELPIRLCNYTDVYKNEEVSPALELMTATATKDEIERFHLEVDDVVITKDSESWNDIGIPAYVRATSDDFICGYHLAFLRSNKKLLNGRFLFRCMQSRFIALQLELEAKGVTRYGIPKSAIGSSIIPFPSIQEQSIITNYLDREITHIDVLIKEKERIQILLEQKQIALISQIITKGLNTDASLQPSGLNWLGDIPKHWQIERAKNVFSVRDERSKTGTEELLTVSHITGITPRSEKDVYMFKADNMTGYKCCFKGDLVINTLWAWMGAMGVTAYNGIVSPDYHVYISKGLLLPKYIELLCQSRSFIAEVNRWSKGVWSSRLRLYPENFFEINLPIPPKVEQQEIIDFIKKNTIKNKELNEALNESLLLLKERRSALITAAVTGQIPIEEMTA